ncbi:hypothetical protein CK203_060139 [Vitis vinifera]|uniref:SWIM-type domain-containing protein n=1 Tax=Vitis vinifera TaxID=29760 RepID=A0A438GMG8_VITVI|nr:hypothetical protein CK203_060139 [Vitis vinifera]
MGPSIIKVDVLMAYVLIKESHMLSLFLKQPLDDDDDIYNMVLFNDGFSRVYVFEAHNGRVKQGVIDEQSTSVNVENNHFSSPSSSSQGVNDDNTIQRHEVVSRCIEFEAIPPVSSTLGKAISAGGCPWKITARGVGATKIVRVHTFENKHNHSAQEESSSVPALRPNKAALVIDDMIRANPDYLPRQICEDFERQHGVKLTYNQAWKCKEKAKERIFGLPHNSYKLLPWLCKQLMETNSGTIAEWTSSDKALAYDADDDMFPLAYAIVSSENYYNWFWFLQRLKQLVGEMEVVIISGRHHAIIRSVAEVFGVENHAYCLRHLKEDFSHQLMMGREGKDNALKLLDAVAYARLEIGYNSAMENLRRFDANLAKWLKITILNTGRCQKLGKIHWPKTEDKLLHNIAKSKTVSDGKAKISVDLRQHTCTCLAWQMSGIPCEHACAMIQKMNQDVYEFVDDWYHLFKQEMVYSGTLHPLEFQNLPTVHSDGNVHDPNGYVHVSLDPPVTKRLSWKTSTATNQAKFREQIIVHCSHCNGSRNCATCNDPNI